MVKALGHLVLKVRDLDRSVGFYRDLLGLDMDADRSIRRERPEAVATVRPLVL